MKKVKVLRVVQISNALSLFTNADQGGPALVSGGVGNLQLAYHIAATQELLKPAMTAFNQIRTPLVEQCRLSKVKPTDPDKLDWMKLQALLEPHLEEEIEIPDLKPMTWAMLEKAKVEVDPALILMLGDFLQGSLSEETLPSP